MLCSTFAVAIVVFMGFSILIISFIYIVYLNMEVQEDCRKLRKECHVIRMGRKSTIGVKSTETEND